MFVKPHPEVTVLLGHNLDESGKPVDVTTPVAVLHPHTRQPIPRDGIEVPEDAYWTRRLRDGDVVLAEPPAPVSEVAADREAQAMASNAGSEASPAPGTIAQVAFMLTNADKAVLTALGYSSDQIAQFKPEEGKRLIAGGVKPAPEPAHTEERAE